MVTTRKNVKTREGKRIAKMRWEQGMSFKDIIKKSGRSYATVHRLVTKFKPNSNEIGVSGERMGATFSGLAKKTINPNELITAITNLDKAIAEKKELESRIISAQSAYDKAKLKFEKYRSIP
jgi:DNA-binding transcriptional regulator LsrR (DeoR family)